ncbi:hypothetical protein [Janthinobacterium sp. RB2R34]|uniref:hypothetical protein n=1 Tax=Janthinobacterium sp. RB2R34 TaxID=3424193 RepID=UPI003F5239A5
MNSLYFCTVSPTMQATFGVFRRFRWKKIVWRAKTLSQVPSGERQGKQWLIGLQKAVIIFG